MPQARNPHGEGRIARVACDRGLVIDDADRDPLAAEASDDPEALVVASQDDRAYRFHVDVVTPNFHGRTVVNV